MITPDFASIMAYQHQRLAMIGSKKDPAMFQAMRQFVDNDSTKNRTIIINWADEKHNFGCRFKCKFCSWRNRAEETGDIAPTKDAVRKFLAGFQGTMVTISGGGDPLFDYELNWPRLAELVNWIHELGYLVEVITKETDLVSKMIDQEGCIANIDAWNFSFENATRFIENQIHRIALKRMVRVSKVCSPGFSTHMDMMVYVRVMLRAGCYKVILREDFYAPPNEADKKHLMKLFQEYDRGEVLWLPNKVCSDNFYLVGGTVERSEHPIFKIEKDAA
jgi:hypothetical protein